jgi:hypothetical protein
MNVIYVAMYRFTTIVTQFKVVGLMRARDTCRPVGSVWVVYDLLKCGVS